MQSGRDERGNRSTCRVPFPNLTLPRSGDVDVPRAVHCNSRRITQPRRDEQRRDCFGRCVPFLNRVVEIIGEVDVARAVHRNTIGIIQPRSDERRDRLGRCVPFLNRVRTAIGEVNVARAIHRNALGIHQSSGDERRDRLGRCVPFLNRVVTRISDVDVPRAVHRHACGIIQSCGDERRRSCRDVPRSRLCDRQRLAGDRYRAGPRRSHVGREAEIDDAASCPVCRVHRDPRRRCRHCPRACHVNAIRVAAGCRSFNQRICTKNQGSLSDGDGLPRQVEMSGPGRSRGIRQEIQVHHTACHLSDCQPALIAGRSKHP